MRGPVMTAETKHTPGPWFVDLSAWPWGEVEIRTDARPQSGLLIATVHPQQDTGANAHLIAAAPAMLEALERIESFAADVHPDSYRAFVRHTCRAAIARARGEG